MFLYIFLSFMLLYISPLIGQTISIKKIDRNNHSSLFWIIISFAIVYIIIYGLRDYGGADDFSYKLYYEQNYGGSFFQIFATDKEPLFNVLKYIGYTFHFNYKFVFLGYAVFQIVFLSLGIKNYYNNKTDAILYISSFLFISYSAIFTTMRQAAAMTVLFFMYSIKDLKWKKRIILWILLIFCHYGFIILLPIELLMTIKKYKVSNKTKIVVPIVCYLVGHIIKLNELISFITRTLGMFNYMNSESNYSHSSNLGIVIWILFILYVFNIIYSGYKNKPSADEKEQQSNAVSFGQMMYFSLIFLTSEMRWANRLSYYYLLFVPIIIIRFFKSFSFKTSNDSIIVKYILISIMYVLFIIVMKNVLGEEGYVWSLNFFN